MQETELRNHLIGIQERQDIMINQLTELIKQITEEEEQQPQEEPEEKEQEETQNGTKPNIRPKEY